MGLRKLGHVVDEAADGEDGLWRAEAGAHDILVLDLGLPKIDGMDVLGQLRASGNLAPVLILTARDSKENLKLAEEADVEVFVVEYMTAARQTEFAGELEAELEALTELGIPMYLGEDRDLTEIYDQSAIQTDGTDGGTDDGDTGSDIPPVEPVDQDIIGTSKADDLEGGAGDDEMRGGKGMDELFGGDGNDVLSGNKGHDYIEGGDGDDLITGGKGHDELLGGEGADTFVFKGRFGSDVIKDFDVAEDELVLANNAQFTVTEVDEGVMLEFSNGASIEFEAVQIAEFEDFFFG